MADEPPGFVEQGVSPTTVATSGSAPLQPEMFPGLVETSSSDMAFFGGAKRKADDECESETEPEGTGPASDGAEGSEILSKRQIKKQRRQKAWEDSKERRKAIRKEKRHNRQARKRAEKELQAVGAKAGGQTSTDLLTEDKVPMRIDTQPIPLTFIIDCDFERYMTDNEIVSLSTQIVRSYSENRKGLFRAHLVVSSFSGMLRERFEGTMGSHHKKWKGVQFEDHDFIRAVSHARDEMRRIGIEYKSITNNAESDGKTPSWEGLRPTPVSKAALDHRQSEWDIEKDVEHSDIVYLTSDSPVTLATLDADTIYVIGGLVDRNREKGLCYKRAREHKVRTAKLPIGEYMSMSSRHILTTNQVVEIMSNFLEEGDWGKAFVKVIPPRKGGALRGQEEKPEESDDGNASGESGE